MTNKHININVPVLARVEGEGALDLRIEDNQISELKLRIYEPPRYFEKFLEGRSYTDVPDIVARICGICPVAYQMSAVQAIEIVFKASPSKWIQNMRRLMYCGEWIQSHSLHIHMLAAPDFLGFNSVIEMAQQYPREVTRGLTLQSLGNELIGLVGGRSVHPVGVKIGGFFHAPDQQACTDLLEKLKQARQDAVELVSWTASLPLTDDEQEFESVSLHHPDVYAMMEGRLVSDKGLDIDITEFDEHFHEFHQPQSTALHCLLHDKPYLVGPLARINNNWQQLPAETKALIDKTPISFPSRNMFHSIVARAAEIHFAVNEAIRLLENYQQIEQSYDDVTVQAGTGFGCTEAPRGFLWHSFELNEEGVVSSARIVPPTSQNQARIEQDIENALMNYGLAHSDSELQLHAEKVIRNYDPCISCATHFLKLDVERVPYQDVATTAVINGYKGPVTIIAVGSPYFPDNLAWQLVDELTPQLGTDNIQVIKLDRPASNLCNYLNQPGCIYILDTLITGSEKQHLQVINTSHLKLDEPVFSSHDLGVSEALILAREMGQNLDNTILVGIPVKRIEQGITPSMTTHNMILELNNLLQG